MALKTFAGLPEDYLADIGRVIVLWSSAEYTFHVHLTGIPKPKADRETSPILGRPLNKQVAYYRASINDQAVFTDWQKGCAQKILDEVLALRQERDLVAHSQWHAHSEKDGRFSRLVEGHARRLSVNWRRRFQSEYVVIPQQTLQDVAQRIQRLDAELSNLGVLTLQLYIRPLPASVEKWQPLSPYFSTRHTHRK